MLSDYTWLQQLRGGWRTIAIAFAIAVVGVLLYWLQASVQRGVRSERCRQAYERARTAADTAIADRLMADGPDPKLNGAAIDCGTLRRTAPTR